MKNSTRKVVILDNLTSPYICQAILILKDSEDISDNIALKEAEKIVAEYISRNKKDGKEDVILYSRANRPTKRINIIPALLLFSTIAFILILIFGLILR